jgi:hypothetical protein
MQTSGPQPASTGFRALMRNRGFVNLWVGQIISQLADKVFFVLLIALVPAPTFSREFFSGLSHDCKYPSGGVFWVGGGNFCGSMA